MERAWIRRPIMVSAVVVLAVVLTLTLPAWLLIAALFDVVRGLWRMPTVRLLAFALCWSWLEVCGITGALLTWSIGRGKDMRAQYALQRWWAARLIGSLRVTCGLGIEVEGVDSLTDGPLLVLGRHASLGDALVSAWAFGSLAHRFPRYVMKKELTLDPCLDIVGHRIPNWFVDRGSMAAKRELEGIAAMAQGMGERDVAVIFPEGTRANDDKRRYLVDRLEKRSPHRHRKFIEMQHLLPPRPAGANTLLATVPDADVVLMWHVGFEGLDTFGGILRRLARSEPRARVVLETIARSDVPEGDAFADWLDDQWMAIDRSVATALAARP